MNTKNNIKHLLKLDKNRFLESFLYDHQNELIHSQSQIRRFILHGRKMGITEYLLLEAFTNAVWENTRNGKLFEDGIWRKSITLEDAIEKVFDLLSIERLKKEYTEEEFDRLFMCKFIED